jgi:hypothetical protein
VRERRPGESVDEKKGERGLSLFFFFLLTWGIVLGREAWPAGGLGLGHMLDFCVQHNEFRRKGIFTSIKETAPYGYLG